MARTDLPFRKGVGIMLFNKDGHVFVAKRIDMTSEAWQMPQGGIDDGETVHQAALRELGEEIGTNNATILAESKEWLTYDLPDELVPLLWKGKYRGQEQKWFAMRLEGPDSQIDIDGPDAEFSEWKWAPIDTLPDLIVTFKRDMYLALAKEFREYAKPI
jgi:putative (di)nucleoside polyphosphate hydrolase